MKTQDGFTLMDKSEVKTYLAKQKVSRTINKLQVHHMDLPNYYTWKKTDKKYSQNYALAELNNYMYRNSNTLGILS